MVVDHDVWSALTSDGFNLHLGYLWDMEGSSLPLCLEFDWYALDSQDLPYEGG
jgi:hypothetical protein